MAFNEPTQKQSCAKVKDILDLLRPLHDALEAHVEDVIARYGST